MSVALSAFAALGNHHLSSSRTFPSPEQETLCHGAAQPRATAQGAAEMITFSFTKTHLLPYIEEGWR